MSTEQPDQAIRQIPPNVIEHARDFAARCATYDDLRTRTPLLETSPEDLYRRVGRRLSGAEHACYGMVRQARRLNFAGARLSHRELGDLVGRHPDTCKRAVRVLLRLELLRVVPQFRDGGIATTLGYDRSQTRNAYALGSSGKEPRVLPGLGGAPPPRRSPLPPCIPHSKVATLSDGRTESLQLSVSPSCLPSTNSTGPNPRGEVSPSASDRPLTRPSMPASPGRGSRGRGLATLGEVAALNRRPTRQDARGEQGEDFEEELRDLAPRLYAARGCQ